MLVDTDYLKTVHIDALSRAARAAGLSWKSGTLSKQGIIDRLAQYPSMAAAAVAMLKRENAPMGRVTYRPAAPLESFQAWLDEDDTAPKETPPKAGVVAPTVPQVDLSAYALRTELGDLARDYTQRINAEAEARTRENTATLKTLNALQDEVQALRTQRPIEVHLPNRPPTRIEGATHRQFPDLLAWLSTIKRIILTGPAGTGKSRAAAQCAEALGLPFHLQTPVTQAYEFLGHRDAHGVFHETPTFIAYTQGGVLLMDEADSSSPDALLSANPILDGNGFAMFGDGKLHKQHPDFHVILNMNTMGDGASLAYSGRNPLDGATIARFGGMLHWDVDPQLEASMAQGEGTFYKAVLAVRALMQQRSILTVNATPRHILIGASLLRNPHFSARRPFILESTLKNGPVADIWPDVLRLPAVQTFLQG